MKKILLLLTLFALVGCSKDSDSEPQESKSEYLQKTIIGTWVRFAQSSSPNYDEFRDAVSKDTISFQTSGKYHLVVGGGSEKTAINGDYSIEESRLFLSHTWLYYLSFIDSNTMRLRETGSNAYVYKYRRIK